MSGSSKERIAELDKYSRELAHLAPDAIKAFGTLSREAQKAGALDHKVKELMALAIGVTSRCEGCIAYHARNSLARRSKPAGGGGDAGGCGADGRRAGHGACGRCAESV